MGFAHETQDADAVDADLPLEVDETPEADLVDDSVVGEGSRENRKNTLKLHHARSFECDSRDALDDRSSSSRAGRNRPWGGAAATSWSL